MRQAASTLALLAALLTLPAAGLAQIQPDTEGIFRLYGDFRIRSEWDWDSQRTDGSERENRFRMRLRARLGFNLLATDHLTFGARLRTGDFKNQQSGHWTWYQADYQPDGDHDLFLDRWFARVGTKRSWAWAGRRDYPFYKPDDMFWDSDVTLPGIAAGHDFFTGEGALELVVGYFSLLDGAVDPHGQMAAGQLLWDSGNDHWEWKLAGGLAVIEGEEGAVHLRNGNGERDYTLWNLIFQAELAAAGKPLLLGLELTHNSEGYSPDDPDPFTAANWDQTDGWVVSATWGRRKERGDWRWGYQYAHIETLALHASYAQDDWVRWGGGGQTDSSDFRGHEFRAERALGPRQNLVARLFLVEAITSVQDGKRFRIDYNMKF